MNSDIPASSARSTRRRRAGGCKPIDGALGAINDFVEFGDPDQAVRIARCWNVFWNDPKLSDAAQVALQAAGIPGRAMRPARLAKNRARRAAATPRTKGPRPLARWLNIIQICAEEGGVVQITQTGNGVVTRPWLPYPHRYLSVPESILRVIRRALVRHADQRRMKQGVRYRVAVDRLPKEHR